MLNILPRTNRLPSNSHLYSMEQTYTMDDQKANHKITTGFLTRVARRVRTWSFMRTRLHPMLLWGSCCSVVCSLLSVLQNIVCHFDLFLFTIVFSVNRLSASDLPLGVFEQQFAPRLGQTKDYNICMYCFFAKHTAKHTALKRKSKEWLARIQDNVSE